MTANPMRKFLEILRGAALLQDGKEQSDGQLLARFVEDRDDLALITLVRRHAPMVWSVCRRNLTRHDDAEDAFQATFLVFLRKAATIRARELLANWLYGVAYQTSRKVRQTAAKRPVPLPTPEPPLVAAENAFGPELLTELDRELSRLPEKYRSAVVLCDLQGKSLREAAQQMRVAEGTVGSRLARGRTLLANRLRRRGVGVSATALATMLPQQAALGSVPAALLAQTIKNTVLVATGDVTAAGAISAQVSTLAQAVLRAGALAKQKAAGLVLLIINLVVSGAMVTHHLLADRPTENADIPPRDLVAAKPLQGFDEPTVTAWKKAGAQVGWMGKNKFGFLKFDTRPDKLAAAVPAFQFASWHEKLLAGLPNPAVPFGLCFNWTQDAGLKELAPLKNLQALVVRGINVTDAGLKELAPLKNLQALVLQGTAVTDAGLKELAPLKSLQTLNLNYTGVTDKGLKELAGLKSLQHLYFPFQATDAGLKELAGLKSLKTLSLWNTKVIDKGLKELAGLKSLQRLDLSCTPVTDAGLKELAGLKSLQLLVLQSTKVTDKGLKELAGLKTLQFLNLSYTQVTDEGLQELTGLKNLQLLILGCERVTDAGLRELRKALPACEIRDEVPDED